MLARSEPCGVLPEWMWVDDFLTAKFPTDSLTLRNYGSVWRVWQQFLLQERVSRPADVTRELAAKFLRWRMETVARVTAISQIHIFHSIMEEATLRDMCVKNPLRNLGWGRGRVPEKPEVSPELEQEIRHAIERDGTMYKDFLRVSMELGIYQARRIAETRLPLANVDFERDRLRFWVKGGRWHPTILHPRCKAVLLPLKTAGKEWSFDTPTDPDRFSYIWHVFLERHGFTKRYPKLCFHSFRVSCVTRLARAGVTISKALKFVGHSSFLIHQVYNRITVDDLEDCIDAL